MAQEDFVIRETDIVDEALRTGILGPLVEYNGAKTQRSDHRPLIIALDDLSGQVIGGLWAHTGYDWLFVQLLFVPASLRGRGLGSELMQRAEDEARRRGCHSAWLDTFEFQARGFYERIGYDAFAELPHYPVGPRHFMKKALRSRVKHELPADFGGLGTTEGSPRTGRQRTAPGPQDNGRTSDQ